MNIQTLQEFQARWRSITALVLDNSASTDDIRAGTIENQTAARIAHYARTLAAWVSSSKPDDSRRGFVGEGLLLVTEWSVWESSEHIPLYLDWRDLNGGLSRPNTLTLESHPGHVLGSGEFDAAVGLIMLALVFGWGLRLGDTGTGRHVMFNHDGTIFASHAGATHADHLWLQKTLA